MKKIINSFYALPLIFLAACGSDQKEENKAVDKQEVLNSTQMVVGIGKVLPPDGIVELSSINSGIIESISVKAGDTVKAGAILINLSAQQEQLNVDEAQAKLTTQLAKNKSDEINLKAAELKYKELQLKYETSKNLLSQGAETQEVVNADHNAMLQQEQEWAKAKQQIKVNNSLNQELKNQIEQLKLVASDKIIRAPKDGIILSLNAKMGQLLNSNSVYAEFATLSPVIIECEVDELYAEKVKLGQKVQINAIGDTTILANGIVEKIGAALENKSILYETVGEGTDRRVRRLTITLTQKLKPLLINDKVECKIQLN